MYPQMSMLEVKRMTLADFEVLQEAYALSQVDKRFLASYEAWQSAQVQASDKKGKAVVRKFKQLFDYQKEISEIRSSTVSKYDSANKEAARLAALANCAIIEAVERREHDR